LKREPHVIPCAKTFERYQRIIKNKQITVNGISIRLNTHQFLSLIRLADKPARGRQGLYSPPLGAFNAFDDTPLLAAG